MLREVRTIEIAPSDIRRRELATPFFQRAVLPVLRGSTKFVGRLTPAGVLERLRKEVVYAGSPPGWDAERVLAMKVLTTAGGVIGLFVLGKYVGKLHNFQVIVLALLGLFVGYYLPEW